MNALTWDRAHLWRFRASLVRVIDADTAVLLADLGFFARYEVRVRLLNFSAPESNTLEGKLGAVRLRAALLRGAGDWPLRVVTHQRETIVAETRSFERFVGEILVAQSSGELTNVVELLHTEVPRET